MHTTASAPASAWRRNAASNLPGAGAAVSGSSARGAELLVERLDGELGAVLELLVAEADRQRDHLDAVGGDILVGEVAAAVGDDADGHEVGAPWSAPAGGRTVHGRYGDPVSAGRSATSPTSFVASRRSASGAPTRR